MAMLCPSKSATILLAEDEPMVRKLLQTILQKRQWDVVIAIDGKQAVKLWESESIDLILMDVQMPEMDGLEASQVIREREKEKESSTPIIGLTAHSRKEDEEMCLAAGMTGYLTKPFDLKKLFALVEQALENQLGRQQP